MSNRSRVKPNSSIRCVCGKQAIFSVYVGNRYYYCAECFNLHFMKCDMCGDYHLNQEVFLASFHLFESRTEYKQVEMNVCSHCANSVSKCECGRIFYSALGNTLCGECAKKAKTCSDCGRLVTLYAVLDGRVVCDVCITNYKRCIKCSKLTRNYKRSEIGEIYCDECAPVDKQCSNCQNIFLRDLSLYNFDNRKICRGCAERMGGVLLSWNYKPAVYCLNVDREEYKPTTFGVEIETLAKIPRPFAILEIKKLFDTNELFLKFDGSIDRDNGIEIVTQPYSYKKMIDSAIISRIYDLEGRLIDTHNCVGAGLHIHVSKHSFNDMMSIRIADFMINHRRWVEEFAGRPANQYCVIENDHDEALRRIQSPYDFRKYYAYNVRPSYSNEFRIFNRTCYPDKVIGYIEFIMLIMEISKNRSITPSKIEKNASKYTNLTKILNKSF